GARTCEGGRDGRPVTRAATLAPSRIVFCVAVPATERLDRFLADQLALSRTQAARLIADKRVTAAGRPLRASALLERGAEVSGESSVATRRSRGGILPRVPSRSPRRSTATPRTASA